MNDYIDNEIKKLRGQGYTSTNLSREIENREIPEQEIRYMGVINSGLVKDDNPLSFYDDKELIDIRDRMEAVEADEMYNEYLTRLDNNTDEVDENYLTLDN